MSDAAFKTAAYSAYTTQELRYMADNLPRAAGNRAVMEAEIARRERVKTGDVSVMTPGERLRFATKR